jgi:pimeloyl-ACP methyl ester carboxylesterase
MERSIQFQERRISYDLVGAGNAIVLLHGFIESRKIWKDFLSGLSKEFRVLAIDLPGHGKSEVVAECHTMRLMAEVVNAVMEDAGIDKALIVGHSMGGYVSLAFGENFPAKVAGIALFHSQAAPDSEEAKENRRRTIRIVEQNRAGFIKQFIPDLFDPGHVDDFEDAIRFLTEEASLMSPDGIIAAISGMRDRESGLEYLKSASIPFLFLAGKQDSRIPYRLVLEQASIPSHSEVLILDNVGHMGYFEAPEITFQAIRHFAMKCYGV